MNYNGWKNKETWNVALWINNDAGLYDIAMRCNDYHQFANYIGNDKTPDGVAWNDSALDTARLDELIQELRPAT